MGVQVVSESASKVNLKLPGSHPTMEDLSHSAVPPSYQDHLAAKRKSSLKKNLRGFVVLTLFVALIAAVVVLAVKFHNSQQTLTQCRIKQQMNGWPRTMKKYDQDISEGVQDFIADLRGCINFVRGNVDWRCLKKVIQNPGGNKRFEDGDSDGDLDEK